MAHFLKRMIPPVCYDDYYYILFGCVSILYHISIPFLMIIILSLFLLIEGSEGSLLEGLDETLSSTEMFVQEIASTTSTPSNGLPLHGARGMNNIGNSCYFNSIIQALTHSDSFLRMLDRVSAGEATPAGVVIDRLKDFVADQWASEDTISINPSALFDALHAFTGGADTGDGPIFVRGKSDDAQIALGIVFDAILQGVIDRNGWIEVIQETIGFQVARRWACPICTSMSENIIPGIIHDLKLEGITETIAFEDLVKTYMRQRQYMKCSSCSHESREDNRLSFGNNELLMFFLNRYSIAGKVKKSVEIPQYLNMNTIEDSIEDIYRLIAVVRHDGGHYTVDVLHSVENIWIRMDDHNVRRIVEPDMRGEQPLIVFFERVQ